MVQGKFEGTVKADKMDKSKKFYKAKISDNDIKRQERDDVNKKCSMTC